MTDTKNINPDDYPHTLSREGDRVFLVTRLKDGGEDRRSLGTSSEVMTAYIRWNHMRRDHSQGEANAFMWGFLTGVSVGLWEEIERLVKRT